MALGSQHPYGVKLSSAAAWEGLTALPVTIHSCSVSNPHKLTDFRRKNPDGIQHCFVFGTLKEWVGIAHALCPVRKFLTQGYAHSIEKAPAPRPALLMWICVIGSEEHKSKRGPVPTLCQ